MQEIDQPLTFQQQFFEAIVAKFPRKADAIDELCELLHSSKDPVYRRLRGDTLLTPDELQMLCMKYQISLDAMILGRGDQVVFSFTPFSSPIKSFEHFLGLFQADLVALKRIPDVHVYYASAEMPIFTYMLFPEIIAFKLFVWGRTTWNFDFLKGRKWEMGLFPPSVFEMADELVKLYISIPSTELITVNVVDNTLNQIENTAFSGNFANPQDALMLCDRIRDWVNLIKAQTVAGRKFTRTGGPSAPSATMKVFHNEMLHTNNTVIVSSPSFRAVYTNLANPNVLKTTDARTCEYTENWFKMILDQANPLTDGSEKMRNWFFESMSRRVDSVRRRIEMIVEEGHMMPR